MQGVLKAEWLDAPEADPGEARPDRRERRATDRSRGESRRA